MLLSGFTVDIPQYCTLIMRPVCFTLLKLQYHVHGIDDGGLLSKPNSQGKRLARDAILSQRARVKASTESSQQSQKPFPRGNKFNCSAAVL